MPGQFACPHPGCHRSYHRKEHLVRHEGSHGQLRPFRCEWCGADFYRKDLLNRHIRLSAKCGDSSSEEQQSSSEAPFTQHDLSQPGLTAETDAAAARSLRNDIYKDLGSNITANTSRDELERSYFCHFHPHWPLLDEDTFLNEPQVPVLVTAVLVAGLWMVPSQIARVEAKRQHDLLMQGVTERFLNEKSQNLIWTRPTPECLPYYQAYLIPLIISTYRGTYDFANVIMCNKHLFDLFRQAGVYQQKDIDDASTSPTIRQQYQRLALLHYKVFMHYVCLFRTQFAVFRPVGYFEPAMLQIRVPLNNNKKGLVMQRFEAADDPLVGELIERGTVDEVSQAIIAALLAWDFSLGMIFACMITREKDENCSSVLQRIQPNLFLHLKGWEEDPRDADEP